MGGDYSQILDSMGLGAKKSNDWMVWKYQIENLIKAAIEIVYSKEDWSTHAVLNAALETINSEKGELLEQLFEELDFGDGKEQYQLKKQQNGE